MIERDCTWVRLAGKDRPAVVLDRRKDWAEIVYGTSVEREWPCVVITPQSPDLRTWAARDDGWCRGLSHAAAG